jgi:hypothetical protein
MANGLAYAVLFGWFFVVVYLFRVYSTQQAIVTSIIGGFLILPIGLAVDFPLIPPLDKASIPSLAAFFILRFILGKRITTPSRFSFVGVLYIVCLLVPFVTALNNSESYGFIRGLTSYDALSALIQQWIVLIPFILGYSFIRTADSVLVLLKSLLIAGLLYSILMLFEVRMSPQLHNWIYGYHGLDGFAQQKRYGGFRPTVFLGHGLYVAFFTVTVLLASEVLLKLKERVSKRFSAKQLTVYLFVVLVFCKSIASIIYGAVMLPIMHYLKARLQIKIAVIMVLFAIFYPLMRLYDVLPLADLLHFVTGFDAQRGQSLGYRFEMEKTLLGHVREKIFFGWGGWGRNRVYSEEGLDLTVTDGYWMIIFGNSGLIGFLSVFGLLAMPIFKAASVIKGKVTSFDQVALAGLSLILAVNMFDLLPNDTLTPLTWLVAGALLGRSEELKKQLRH